MNLDQIQAHLESAENREDLFPAADWQIKAVAIAINRCFTEPLCGFNPRKYVHRDIRLAILARLFKRDLSKLTSSSLLWWQGMQRLLDLLYGDGMLRFSNWPMALTYEIDPDALLGVWAASEGLFDAKYPDGKVVRKESERQFKARMRRLDNTVTLEAS